MHAFAKTVLGVLGALIYAAAGALIGSQNAGWFDLEQNANGLLPWLGVGAGVGSVWVILSIRLLPGAEPKVSG